MMKKVTPLPLSICLLALAIMLAPLIRQNNSELYQLEAVGTNGLYVVSDQKTGNLVKICSISQGQCMEIQSGAIIYKSIYPKAFEQDDPQKILENLGRK